MTSRGRPAKARYALTQGGRVAMFPDDSVRGRIQRALDGGGALSCKELTTLSPWGADAVRRDIARMLRDCQLRRADQ